MNRVTYNVYVVIAVVYWLYTRYVVIKKNFVHSMNVLHSTIMLTAMFYKHSLELLAYVNI